jgi:hypothetical protein
MRGRLHVCAMYRVSLFVPLSFPFLPLSRRRRVPSTITFLTGLHHTYMVATYICCRFALETPSTSAGKYAMLLFVKRKHVLQVAL